MNQMHPSPAQVEAHARRELDPEAALRVSDHLGACEACRAHFAAARETVNSSRETDAVSYEELTAWMRDELEPMERYSVAQRLARSKAAQTELSDLQNFATEMRDNATWRRAGEIRRWILPLAAALLVSAGALWWKTNSSPVDSVALRDHGRPIELRSLPPGLQRSLSSALTKGILEVPESLGALQSTPSVLAGEATRETGFRLLTPVGTAVEDGAPVFGWSAYPGATGYRVVVAAIEGDEVLLNQEVSAGTLTWKPESPLARDRAYQWEVEAIRGDEVLAKAPHPPERDARFRVLSQRDAAELAQARAQNNGAHLVLGLAYARAGLITQANEEFDLLGQENPESPIPGKLREALAGATRALDR